MFNNETRGVRRAHSPDFETNYRPAFQRRSGPPFNKKHRGDGYNPPQTIEDKIARLGETGSRNVDIGILAKDIDADLINKVAEEEKITKITSKICQCIVAFPTRVAAYATLVGLISVKHYNLSCQIINTLHASYPVYLEAQKWQEALTIIHLLSSLVNCKVIRLSALLSQFELLLEITMEDNIPQARSDYYVYTVLSSLPYVASELSAQTDHENFDRVLTTIETYLSKRSKDHLNTTRAWVSSDSTVLMDYLDSLWVQMKNFKANNWSEAFLHRPYNDKEYKDIMASSLIPTNSPTIQIPAHSPRNVYPHPGIVFRIFEDDVTDGAKSIPGSDKIERFCIENHIRNIIDEIFNDPKDCARHLAHMYRSDQLPMKHILIEVVLGELFTLPRPKHQEILYHSLLYEFSKIFHSSKNPDEIKFNYDVVLNEAIKILYENLDGFNTTCFTRFVQWISFHLNNTEFLFPWQAWSDATVKEIGSPKAIFVRDVLDHCVRFSFHKKISTLVSAYLSNLMPVEVSVQYLPTNFGSPKADEMATIVKKLIIEKADGKAIAETLNISIEGVEMPEGFVLSEEKLSTKLLKIDIFTATILSIASKSLTHLSSAIGKFRGVFRSLTAVDGGRIQMLQTMHSCLETHPQLQVILVDKFLKADLVSAGEVCDWIFSDSMKPHLLKAYPWELLGNAVLKTSRVHRKLVAEKNELLNGDDKDNDDDKDNEDDVAMKKETDTEIDNRIFGAEKELKDLLLRIFKMFSSLLGDYIRSCESAGTNHMDNWFRWISGRMQQIYYNHHELTLPIHEQIREIFHDQPSVRHLISKFCQ